VEKILVGVIGGYRFAQQLQGPGGRGVIGDANVQEFSSTDLHHNKHAEALECRCYDGQEIAGHNRVGVNVDER
jgi:hypothetical protein